MWLPIKAVKQVIDRGIVTAHPNDTILSAFGSFELNFSRGHLFWYYSRKSTLNCRILIGSWSLQL